MFGRASIQISTGKLIEFQSGDAVIGTLTQNAINAGIPQNDIIEKHITEAEFKALMPKPPAPKDYKALFGAAATAEGKISVLADALGLL
ncbi:MAG: hypothetical protein PHH85_01660 [Candidatus Methanoperedens sp.]|nr:hypothetical protein [Candidatus Methanoperedens sp.]